MSFKFFTFKPRAKVKRNLDGILALNLNFVLSRIAIGMLNIFGPVFLFQLADDAITGVYYFAGYFLLQRVLVLLFSIPAGYFVAKYGYRVSMLWGMAAMGLQLFLLTDVSQGDFGGLFLASFAGAVYISLYFLSFHALFLDDNDESRMGRQIGFLSVLGGISDIVSPLIAGLIIQLFGFDTMFVLSIILLAVSAAPLFKMVNHTRHKLTFETSKVIKYLFAHNSTNSSIILWSVADTLAVIFWPVYLPLVITGYALFGLVFSLLSVVNIITLFVSAKIYDKSKSDKVFGLSTLGVALSWLGVFSPNLVWVLVGSFFRRGMSPLWWMRIRRTELFNGEDHDHLVFAVGHEIIWSAGMIITIAWALVLLVLGNLNFGHLIIPAVVVTLAASIMQLTRNEQRL